MLIVCSPSLGLWHRRVEERWDYRKQQIGAVHKRYVRGAGEPRELRIREACGGIFGDTPVGFPHSQLAVLPGTSHVTLVSRADLLLSIIPPFLDAPMPEAE